MISERIFEKRPGGNSVRKSKKKCKKPNLNCLWYRKECFRYFLGKIQLGKNINSNLHLIYIGLNEAKYLKVNEKNSMYL